jgi:hypothetical protein
MVVYEETGIPCSWGRTSVVAIKASIEDELPKFRDSLVRLKKEMMEYFFQRKVKRMVWRGAISSNLV